MPAPLCVGVADTGWPDCVRVRLVGRIGGCKSRVQAWVLVESRGDGGALQPACTRKGGW